MAKWEKIIASILFIIVQASGFFFAYALMLGAVSIDLPKIAVLMIVAVALLSTWVIFSYFAKEGE